MSEELWFLTLSGRQAVCELTFESEKEVWDAQKKVLAAMGEYMLGREVVEIASIHGTVVVDTSAFNSVLVASYSQVIVRAQLVRKVQEDANKPSGIGKFGMS